MAGAGYAVGMVHVESAIFSSNRPFHPELIDVAESGCAEIVPQRSSQVNARLALLLNPLVFRSPLDLPFHIRAEHAVIVLSQPAANAVGEPYYDLSRVLDHCRRALHTDVMIAPMSAVCRDNLQTFFPDMQNVSSEDWTDIIDVEAYSVDRSRYRDKVPVIGRHSRPGDEKWPATAADMLAAYPARDDLRVRMLGVGPKVDRLVATIPANWELFHFGDLETRHFLSSIDFWVYFHDPAWVESFGRAIAEAMASGAVTLLPGHFEKSFSEGAIYCEPSDVLDIVDRLYSKPREYREWSNRARRTIARDYGEDRYLRRIERLIGPPGLSPGTSQSQGVASADGPLSHRRSAPAPDFGSSVERKNFDVVYVGDFGSGTEDWPGVAAEIDLLRRHRLTTGIVHLQLNSDGCPVNADVHSKILEGDVEAVDPRRSVVEARTIVLTTTTLEGILSARPVQHVFADQVILLCDQVLGSPTWPQELQRLQKQTNELFGGRCQFSAVRPTQYRRLQTAEGLVPIAPAWQPSTPTKPVHVLRRLIREIAPHLPWRVGVFSDAGNAPIGAPGNPENGRPEFGDAWQVWHYGYLPNDQSGPKNGDPPIDRSEMAVGRFLDKVDAVAVLPTGMRNQASHTAALLALRSGLPVILPESWREDFGLGPLYRHPSDYGDTLQMLAERQPFRREIRSHTSYQLDRQRKTSAVADNEKIATLAGDVTTKPARHRHTRSHRVLFMSSNGVGVGHLSRLIAIARRVPEPVEPVFLSLSQALPVVRQFGFHGEFLAYHLSTLSDYEDWNKWLQVTLEQIFDAYAIGTVVFDGSMPYAGLCRAVSIRKGCRMVWVRRGMWRSDQDNSTHLARARYADLIIEPDDIAAELDSGQAAEHRREVMVVDPIRLLDPTEVLTRQDSCRNLDLSPKHRYALVQLGAGNNFSNVEIIDRIIRTLREIGKVRPVLAEWLTAETPHDMWPDVPRLRCFPISRYFRAFDFTVSAVGYNSFNEIISFGLPSVLVPNLNQMMDDQAARARFADEHEAAIHLDFELRPMLREVIAAIHDKDIRQRLTQNCRKLARPNGAAEAASLVAQVAEYTGSS
jgi:UDP:flavonoid glycosyltransferase YjiC (YdhE family)